MKAIAIYPDKRVVIDDLGELEEMQEVVGGNIEPITIFGDITMYANEEGLFVFDASDFNSVATDIAGLGGRIDLLVHGVLGPVLVCGPVDRHGDHIDVPDYVITAVRRVAREAGAEVVVA